MGSYEIAPEQALESAIRLVKEGRMHAVKLEGGRAMAPTAARIARAGIPVLGHVGLTPQRQHALGGFRAQARTAAGARAVVADALALQAAGCFGVVVEAVPAAVGAAVTRALRMPTIGIGAGAGCAGQVLVQADMAGCAPPGRRLPRFVKRYGDVWGETLAALEAYRGWFWFFFFLKISFCVPCLVFFGCSIIYFSVFSPFFLSLLSLDLPRPYIHLYIFSLLLPS